MDPVIRAFSRGTEMEVIAAYWFIWLAGIVVFGGLALFNQVRRMKNIANFSEPSDIFSGLGLMAAFGMLAYLCTGLLVVSIILNIIAFAKA